MPMSAHIIGNPVPTPEQMGEILGLSSERVAAVRRIMGTLAKKPNRDGRSVHAKPQRGRDRPLLGEAPELPAKDRGALATVKAD